MTVLGMSLVLMFGRFAASGQENTRVPATTLAVSIDYSVDAAEGSFYAHRAELPPSRANALLARMAEVGVTNGFSVLLPVSHFEKWVAWREGRENHPETYQHSFKPTPAGFLELTALRSTIAKVAIDLPAWGEYRRAYLAQPTWEENRLLLTKWRDGSIAVYDDTKPVAADAVLIVKARYYTRNYSQSGFGYPIEGMDAKVLLTWHGKPVALTLGPEERRGLVRTPTNGLEDTSFEPNWREKYLGGISEADNVSQDILDAFSQALKSLVSTRSNKEPEATR